MKIPLTLPWISTRITILLLIALLGPLVLPGARAEPTACGPAQTEPGQPVDLSDREALEFFFDELVGSYIRYIHTPGLAVAVFQGDEVLLAKGYGTTQSQGGKPIDPERTLFRVGPASALVTVMAAMQLVERGQLRLDEDINH
jgi:CubicO group peptidase (beta-lactamase class C family)